MKKELILPDEVMRLQIVRVREIVHIVYGYLELLPFFEFVLDLETLDEAGVERVLYDLALAYLYPLISPKSTKLKDARAYPVCCL